SPQQPCNLADPRTSDEEALRTAASGGSIELERWSGMAVPLIERLEYIVYNMFPMPRMRPEQIGQQTSTNHASQLSENNHIAPESSNKENDAPADQPGSPPSGERVPDSQPEASGTLTNDQLPPPLALLFKAIRSSITSFFQEKPPHTIQRLAELVLEPTKHYKTLPAYLRAVDRVISVTSSADVFPFNAPSPANAQSNGLVQAGNSSGVYLAPDYAQGLGSDESLGGALLTPIPWLNGSSFDGEDTNILDEGVEEPLPAQPAEDPETVLTVPIEAEDVATTASPEPSDEVPHARGPIVLGVQDMGLQDGKGVEMNLGPDGTDGEVTAAAAADAVAMTTEEEEQEKNESTADKDGDIVLSDEQPQEKEEPKKTDASTESKASEAESKPLSISAEAGDAEEKA
ncbi:uncharacterized protein N7511_005572, partial [Penicillium nucicola]|uniref:uncharacterized protein n=1 Tax=Penicillium nucicola TaxID=1850975 RepID=UPI002544F9C0